MSLEPNQVYNGVLKPPDVQIPQPMLSRMSPDSVMESAATQLAILQAASGQSSPEFWMEPTALDIP